MSALISLAGTYRSTIALAGTVYNWIAVTVAWSLDFSDEDNSFYLALL